VTLADALIGPFVDYGFMRRALAGGVALALGAAPLGVFLVLRRMSLVGDAIAHAILPGAALATLLFGASTLSLSVGAFGAAILVFVGAGLLARFGRTPEDAGLAVFYLAALALGGALASRGDGMDLERLLFGSPLGMDAGGLLLAAGAATASLLGLAVIGRPLAYDTADPDYLGDFGRSGATAHLVFLALVAVNLVAGFHALGALLAVGLMILPGVASRYWATTLTGALAAAIVVGIAGVVLGLLVSFHSDVAAGPCIVSVLVLLTVGSGLVGPQGGVLTRLVRPAHLEG
jgi:zinc/manganese transport system permease protein